MGRSELSETEHHMTLEQRRALALFWRSGVIDWDVDMGSYCTLRAGGRTEALIQVESRTELDRLLPWLDDQEIKWRVIGRGSNILVSDKGFHGVLMILRGDLCSITCLGSGSDFQGPALVRAGAGCSMARLVAWCSRKGLAGLEFMSGIPGSIGGAVRMNAGAWGGVVGDLLDFVEFVDRDGRRHEVRAADLDFFYREMRPRKSFLKDAVIVAAGFILTPGDSTEIERKCREIVGKRRAKHLTAAASAGSFFKNPANDSAGRLIEAAGLKGFSKGDAMVSHDHANFIVNTGRASADDITALMREVQQRVFRHSGVLLEPEVHFL